MPMMPLSGSNDKMNSGDQVDANTGKWWLCCDYCQVVNHFKILSLLRPILISEILKCGGKNEPYQWNMLICAHLVWGTWPAYRLACFHSFTESFILLNSRLQRLMMRAGRVALVWAPVRRWLGVWPQDQLVCIWKACGKACLFIFRNWLSLGRTLPPGSSRHPPPAPRDVKTSGYKK